MCAVWLYSSSQLNRIRLVCSFGSIRETHKDLPIIALTAAAMIEDRHKAIDAGMNDHLAKPIQSEAIKRLMMSYLDWQIRDEEKPLAETPPDSLQTNLTRPAERKLILLASEDVVTIKQWIELFKKDHKLMIANSADKLAQMKQTEPRPQWWVVDQDLLSQLFEKK
jgi:response regulator of citrate/malate metabolism